MPIADIELLLSKRSEIDQKARQLVAGIASGRFEDAAEAADIFLSNYYDIEDELTDLAGEAP